MLRVFVIIWQIESELRFRFIFHLWNYSHIISHFKTQFKHTYRCPYNRARDVSCVSILFVTDGEYITVYALWLSECLQSLFRFTVRACSKTANILRKSCFFVWILSTSDIGFLKTMRTFAVLIIPNFVLISWQGTSTRNIGPVKWKFTVGCSVLT